jgi:hypothetical protein
MNLLFPNGHGTERQTATQNGVENFVPWQTENSFSVAGGWSLRRKDQQVVSRPLPVSSLSLLSHTLHGFENVSELGRETVKEIVAFGIYGWNTIQAQRSRVGGESATLVQYGSRVNKAGVELKCIRRHVGLSFCCKGYEWQPLAFDKDRPIIGGLLTAGAANPIE